MTYDYFTAPTPDPIPEDAVLFMGEYMKREQINQHLENAIQYINDSLDSEYFEIYRYFKAYRVFDYIAFAGWVLEPVSEHPEYIFRAKLYVGARPGEFIGTFDEVLCHMLKPTKEIFNAGH